jgi:CHAD domain-containing protein
MSYRLQSEEGARAGLARTAREQLDAAAAALSDGIADDPVGSVHAARKAVKKERSLLRLARAAIPGKRRRRANDRLREASRGLSDVRDADVMIQTLDALAQRFVGQLPQSTFDGVREPLAHERDEQRAQLAGSALGPETAAQLGAVRAELDEWKLRRGGWPALEPGLKRSYRRGRHAMRVAERDRSVEAMHAWRKRAKDLWYHERLLADICGPAVKGQAKDLDRLSDLLGDDHDLGVLAARVATGHAPVDVAGLLGLIDHRRTELQTEALHLGRRVYAESPKAFARRLRRSWETGRAIAGAAFEADPAELAEATRATSAE